MRAVADISQADFALSSSASNTASVGELIGEKLVAETAMLLHCVAPIQALDYRLRETLRNIASNLVPHARERHVLAAICLDPGQALDHAVAHILLTGIGYPNAAVDDLLVKSLATGLDFGPERLPHRRLEQEWLKSVWPAGNSARRTASRLLADSMLGRPLDALGSTRLDIYSLTHAVMYASDLGGRKVSLPRPSRDIKGEAIAALAYSLDAADHDLTAEVLLTWPMLGLQWSPAAVFAFRLLAGAQDKLGFLSGPNFDMSHYTALNEEGRHRYQLTTCYHTIYVMGFLCAASLRRGRTPRAVAPPARRALGAGAAILHLLGDDLRPCWREMVDALNVRQQDAIAPLLLAILLRRARTKGDLGLVRTALEVALQYDLTDGAAPQQAAALLRRTQFLQVAWP